MAVATSRPDATTTGKPNRDWLAELQRETKHRPAAIVIYGPPGIGKTSVGAAAPNPVFLVDSQEDGINTLKASRLLPADIPVIPPCQTWADVLSALDSLTTGKHEFGTLVIDTLGGLERLLYDYVCADQYEGKWGDKGFASFARGYEASLPLWRELLNKLDRLRIDRNMRVIALAHSIVKPFKNPEGEDFDRYVVDMHHKMWSVTHKWADAILFANYYVEAQKERGAARAKGRGGQARFFNTEFSAAYDAKNRHGLPPSIPMGDSGAEAWANLVNEIKAARKDS